MIDRSLKHAGIFAKQVELPFVDQNLIYAKQEVQRVYGFGIVKVMNLINSYQKLSQRAHAAAFINRMLSVIEA